MDVIAVITFILVLCLFWMGLLYLEGRAHDKRERDRMALIRANVPQKHINEVV